ncbi:MAG: hypothetical protein QOC81_2299 [Thermoanaerobaculia bacterium]|jgi:hypothetical protein|nr:hypothetical protein [Thermoanaerobaculia bacterium]
MRLNTILCVGLMAASIAIDSRCDDRVVLYQGLDIKLERITDSMTDAKTCAMFLESGPVYLSVEGKTKVTVWPNSEDIHFAPDGKHLLRIGTASPIRLLYIPKRNALAAPDAIAANQIVKALATHQTVKLRYVAWPSYAEQDLDVELPAFAFVWAKAEKQCGWSGLGVPGTLPTPKLSTYLPEEEGSAGYASVSIQGNRDLGLTKGFDKYGGGCHITLGVHETIGIFKGRWTTRTVDIAGNTKIIVRDQDGAVVFEGKVPTDYGMDAIGGTDWSLAQDIAKALWAAAPLGTISITGSSYPKESVPLYGFRELWSWGMQSCSFPEVQSTQ